MLFNKKILSSSVALALASTAVPALAQDDDLIEEIIVEGGIRASLKRAMDIKRDSTGVADAISAEDMGKFPDTNLAESLQRVTGVSISRQRGEGSQVTVRGFGPEYNLVTLNGRQMPTHNGTNRSFDFGNLASEGISAVVIHKTGKADRPTGGVGSSINIITTKPLEAGKIATFGAKMSMDTSTEEGNDVTPEFSGLYSDTFADDTLGIAISASSQRRNNGVNTASVGGWHTTYADQDGGWGGVPINEAQINRPTSPDALLSIPQSIAFNISEFESERVNGQLTLQWAPVDAVTATLDYTYSEFDLERRYSDLSSWFNMSNTVQTSTWTDGPIASPLIYNEESGNSDFAMGVGHDGSTNENKSTGFNLQWQATDSLVLEFDYHDSTAETAANSPYGTSSLVTMASFNRIGTTAYFDQDMPVLELDMNSGGEVNRPLYKDDMIITGSVFHNGEAKMDVEQSRLSGSLDIADRSSINFGLELTEISNHSVSDFVQRDTWGGISAPGDISHILTRSSIAGAFDQVSSSGDSRQQNEYFTTTLEQIIAVAETLPLSGDQIVGDCGTPYCASTDWNTDRETSEETKAVYLELQHATEFNGMPFDVDMGMRYEETEITSAALAPTYDAVYWLGGNEFTIVQGDEVAKEDYTGEYDLFLPNLDLKLEVRDDVILRASYSETVTRPSYSDIQGGITLNSTSFKIHNADASGGNPGLLPIESENIDLTLEWYYGDADYLSIGYYHKNVENFIGVGYSMMDPAAGGSIANLPHPGMGGLYETARVEGGFNAGEYTAVFGYIEANYPEAIDANGRLYGDAENDLVPVQISQPRNQRAAKADGIEINLQHNFGDSGYGFIINATIANASVSYDDMNIGDQFVLNGLSDSANFIGFYDKGGFQARFAYNWRDKFLAGIGQGQGTYTNPTNVEAYAQLDVSASYEVNDNLTVFFDGINVTESTFRVYGRESHQVLQAGQTGARYNLGIRYSF